MKSLIAGNQVRYRLHGAGFYNAAVVGQITLENGKGLGALVIVQGQTRYHLHEMPTNLPLLW